MAGDSGRGDPDAGLNQSATFFTFASDFVLNGFVLISSLIETSQEPILSFRVDDIVISAKMEENPAALDCFSAFRCVDFQIDIPAWCVDTQAHRFYAEVFGNSFLICNYKSDIKYNFELVSDSKCRLWIFDESQSATPLTLTFHDTFGQCVKTATFYRADVRDAYGAEYAGAEISFDPDFGDVCVLQIGQASEIAIAKLALRQGSLAHRVNRLINASLLSTDSILSLRSRVAQLRSEPLSNQGYFPLSPLMNYENQVSIIVPVYKGQFETEKCLASLKSLLECSEILKHVIVINDNPSDAAIRDVCRSFLGHEEIVYIENKVNLGFVESVNLAFQHIGATEDVVILNNDAVIFERTVLKLRQAAYSRQNVATVAPLTNNGSFLSFPEINGGARISIDEARELDRHCEVIARGRRTEIPVSVGFCMYIVRRAFDEVGHFGAEFGRGYCEEVDWCMRARDLGFVHLAALDSFVWHEGSLSFGAHERVEIISENHKIIEHRYPEYASIVRTFYRDDPIETHRVDLFLAGIPSHVPLVLQLCHSLGGGTVKYLRDTTENLKSRGMLSIQVSTSHDEWSKHEYCELWCSVTNERMRLNLKSFEYFISMIKQTYDDVSALIHSLIAVDPSIISILQKYDVLYSMMLHDFQWFCPRAVLVDDTNRYCGEPSAHQCNECVQKSESFHFPGELNVMTSGIVEWRNRNLTILKGASKIHAPSDHVGTRYRRHFPEIFVDTLPHFEQKSHCKLRVPARAQRPMTIAVVGALNIAKGALFLKELCEQVDRRGLDVEIHLFGAVPLEVDLEGFRCLTDHGRYKPESLGALVDSVRPHFALFPGVWPETYCFVLSELWRLGLCPVAMRIGALSERIRSHAAGILFDETWTAIDLAEQIEDIFRQCSALNGYEFDFGVTMSKSEYIKALLPNHRVGSNAKITQEIGRQSS